MDCETSERRNEVTGTVARGRDDVREGYRLARSTTSVPRLELPRLLDGGKFEPVPSPGVKARKQHQIKRVTNYLVPLLESDSRR